MSSLSVLKDSDDGGNLGTHELGQKLYDKIQWSSVTAITSEEVPIFPQY